MTDVYTSTSYPAYSHDQVTQAIHDLGVYKSTVEDLQKSLQNALDMNSSLNKLLSEKKNLIDNAKAAILEAFDNESFDRENFEVVADALNIELTKEYDVTINVTFSGTITVPLGFDVEGNLENYLNFTAEASGWGTEEIDTDLFEDGVDVNIYKR